MEKLSKIHRHLHTKNCLLKALRANVAFKLRAVESFSKKFVGFYWLFFSRGTNSPHKLQVVKLEKVIRSFSYGKNYFGLFKFIEILYLNYASFKLLSKNLSKFTCTLSWQRNLKNTASKCD